MTIAEAIYKSIVALCFCAVVITLLIASSGSKFPWEK